MTPHDELNQLLRQVFDGPDIARAWLESHVASLEYERPLDLILRGEIRRVITLLEFLARGA